MLGDLAQGGLGVLHHVSTAQERLNGQPAAVTGAAAGGQHVVGAGAVVAQAHRGEGTDEDRPGVTDPQGHTASVAGLDLQVLGGIRVDHGDPGLEIVDQDDAGLPAGQRRGDPLDVLGRSHAAHQGSLHTLGEILAVGDQHRRRKGVVLGLADQVRGDVLGIGAVVGEHRDLGGSGLCVDTDHAFQQTLGCRDVDVARAGDQGGSQTTGPAPGVPSTSESRAP